MVAVRARQPAKTFGWEKMLDEAAVLEEDSVEEQTDGLLRTWRRNSRATCGGILLAISNGVLGGHTAKVF